MKILLVIFLISVAANKGADSAPNVDFKGVASDLLNKVTTLKDNVNKVQSKAENLRSTLQPKADMLDYGIPENPQIIDIANIFQQHKTQRGIESCIQLRDDKVKTLKQELQAIFTQKVTAQLDINQSTLTAILQTLESIFDNIQGTNLDAEIKLCTDNPDRCRLTIEYPEEVDHSQKSIDFISNMIDSLLNIILKTAINPILAEKINDEIYKPVKNCIDRL